MPDNTTPRAPDDPLSYKPSAAAGCLWLLIASYLVVIALLFATGLLRLSLKFALGRWGTWVP